jgi:aryl-alcohol dehydrogenase-like predicted oxidoreductase
MRQCEESLRRLKVDAIDLYQIHRPVEDVNELETGWSTMAQLQEEGKVRWIGVSNFNVTQMERAQAIAPITSLQPPPEQVSEVLAAAVVHLTQSDLKELPFENSG